MTAQVCWLRQKFGARLGVQYSVTAKVRGMVEGRGKISWPGLESINSLLQRDFSKFKLNVTIKVIFC